MAMCTARGHWRRWREGTTAELCAQGRTSSATLVRSPRLSYADIHVPVLGVTWTKAWTTWQIVELAVGISPFRGGVATIAGVVCTLAPSGALVHCSSSGRHWVHRFFRSLCRCRWMRGNPCEKRTDQSQAGTLGAALKSRERRSTLT